MKKVNISQVDALFANGSYPIEFLFFYADGLPVQNIRGALRDLSFSFWPVFGEYKDSDIVFDRYREDDVFDEETVDRDFDIPESSETDAEAISRYELKDLKRLFFIKVLRFHNGVALIPKMNHLSGDGYSYFYFLSALAACSQPGRVPFRSSFFKSMFKPHHRRTVLRDFQFQGMDVERTAQNAGLKIENVMVPRRDVLSLIKEVAASHALRISTNDLLTAKAMKKLVEMHPERWREVVDLTIPIDIRRQVPKYGKRFFGNGIMLHTLTLEKEQIINSPLQETAVQIRRSMPTVTTESYTEYLGALERIISERDTDHFRPFNPEHGCLVTNLSKMPTARLDFGTGVPSAIFPITTGKNSTGILAKNENFILRIVH